jgi:outer membrane immunogenic protein
MKRFTLLATTIATACIASVAVAGDGYHNERNSRFTGPYLGIYGGYDWTDAETGVPGVEPDIDGWETGVFAGIRVDSLLDRVDGLGVGMHGAIEGFYGVSDSDGSEAGVDIEKKDEWGVSFRPGFSFIDEAMEPVGIAPYAIIGYRWTEFEASVPGIGSEEETYGGFELGVGAQLLAYGDWGIRAEYSHVWYEEQDDIEPESDNLRLGLSYHF